MTAALVGLAAGCGGHGSSFATRADGICERQEAAIAALPAERTPDKLAAMFDRRVALAEQEAARLRKLPAPEGLEEPADSLVRAIAAEIAAAKRLRVASLIGDSESIQGALYQGRRALARARAAARRLGLGVCGHVASAASP